MVLGVRATVSTEVWCRRLASLTANLTARPTDRDGFRGTQRMRKRQFSSAKRKGGIQRTPPSRTLNLRVSIRGFLAPLFRLVLTVIRGARGEGDTAANQDASESPRQRTESARNSRQRRERGLNQVVSAAYPSYADGFALVIEHNLLRRDHWDKTAQMSVVCPLTSSTVKTPLMSTV